MSLKAYVAGRLKDNDQTILDDLNVTIEQVKVAPAATEELIKELDSAGALSKDAIARLTEYTAEDVSIASRFIGRLATLEDIAEARAAITAEATQSLVREAATRRINQLWAAIDTLQTEADVIAEFSR